MKAIIKTPITVSIGKLKTHILSAQIIHPLAIHPTYGEAGFWTVTHLKSGHALYRFITSRKVAHAIATKLAALNGWDQSTKMIEKDHKLKMEALAILRAHGFEVSRRVKINRKI
jgi:hypothetical protein